MRFLRYNDFVSVEKKDDFTVSGKFHSQDDEFFVVRGTSGDNLGKLIAIPKQNIAQLVITRNTEAF